VETPGYPKGRGIISTYGNEEKTQIYFAPQEWIDEELTARGLNPDGTPVETGPSGFLPDLDANEKLKGSHLDEIEGVDNSEYIERLRQEDAEIRAEHERKMKEYANKNNGGSAAQQDSTPDDGIARPKLTGKTNKKENPLDEWDDVMNQLDENSDTTRSEDGLVIADDMDDQALDENVDEDE
jgi:hypothetical protein